MPDSSSSSIESKERSLYQQWLEHKAVWRQDPQAAYVLARKANSAGVHLLALEIIECVLEAAKGADRIRLLQQKALALARSAATEQALQTLEQIRAAGGEDPETSGLLGRVYKDLAEGTSDPEERKRFLARSQELYQAGFDRAGQQDAFCGINAAAMAVLMGNQELAQTLATQTLHARSQNDEYYDLATKAEAMSILKRVDEAADLYRRACAVRQDRWADVNSTRNQCRKLSRVLYDGQTKKFDDCFPTGVVAIFAGHMVDVPGRAEPRFPASAEPSVRERIAAWLKVESIQESYSAAASGSDLLFLETAQASGVRTHIVLPFAVEKFVKTSVRPGGEPWVERFRQALDRAESLTIVNDDVADDASSAYDFTNRMIAAKAVLRAKALGWDRRALGVWNGLEGDGGGGTADAVAVWAKAKIPSKIIRPLSSEHARDINATNVPATVPFPRTRTALKTSSKPMVCAVMHVYFEGYFALHENQYPAFRQKVLETMANTLATTSYPPVSRYGFGPDYIFAFESPKAAGMFAIEVLDALAQSLRDAQDITMALPRICLHAGTVQLMVNPVLNQYTHEGTSLTRAGRIVRNLEPGVAYCTEPFAALSALDAVDDFSCEYAGTSRYGGEAQDRLFSVRYRHKTKS